MTFVDKYRTALSDAMSELVSHFGTTLGDLDVLARTVYGEARGESYQGKRAVAHVVINRVRKRMRGDTRIAGAATEPWQFSCWNLDDPNLKVITRVTLKDAVFSECWMAAMNALLSDAAGEDVTEGSTHYHTKAISPKWASGHKPVVTIGNHHFYNTVK